MALFYYLAFLFHMKYFFLILIIILSTASCTEKSLHNGYALTKNGLDYKLLALGEENTKPEIGDFITIDVTYSTMEDSVFFKNKRKVQITEPIYDGCIDECFLSMSLGDSTSFILNAQLFFTNTLQVPLPSFIDNSNPFKVNIRLLNIQKLLDYEKQKQEFLTWIKDFSDYEQLFLKNYLQDQKIDTTPAPNGLYKITLIDGNGPAPEKGDTLLINYEGKFLNGIFFDSTKKRNKAFEFIYGTEWQVIEGMEKALSLMKEGEKSLFIMPSNLAFGAEGSTSGIVPPYTSVIFEVELIKLSKGDTLTTETTLKDTL